MSTRAAYRCHNLSRFQFLLDPLNPPNPQGPRLACSLNKSILDQLPGSRGPRVAQTTLSTTLGSDPITNKNTTKVWELAVVLKLSSAMRVY
jgi:hypothetical protein